MSGILLGRLYSRLSQPASPRRAAAACAIAFGALLCAYVIALALALTLPDEGAIIRNLSASLEDGALTEALQSQPSPFGHIRHKFDMFSECIGLGENLGNIEKSTLYRIAATPFVAPESTAADRPHDAHPCADLASALKDEPRAQAIYFRYWHGYQVYLRAMLSFGSLFDVRRCNAVLLYLSLIFLCLKMGQWYGWPAVPLLFLLLAVESDLLTAPLVTVHALQLAWSYFSIALVMTLLDRDRTQSLRLLLFCFVSGSFFNFISLLAAPQFSPALIAFVALSASLRASPARPWLASLREAGSLALAWFAGFAATWIAKWALAVAVLGLSPVVSTLSVAASGVNYRAYHFALSTPLPATLLAASPSLLLWMGFAVAGLAARLAHLAATGRDPWKMATEWLLLQSPLLIVVVWTEAMRAHSIQHREFAQRAVLLFVLLPLLGLLFSRRESQASAASAVGARGGLAQAEAG